MAPKPLAACLCPRAGRNGKEEWERQWTRRHLREQRKMRGIAKNKGTERSRRVQSSPGVSEFTSGFGQLSADIFGKPPGFMKQENTGNSDVLGMLNRGSRDQRGGGAVHACCPPFCILLGFLGNRKWSSSCRREVVVSPTSPQVSSPGKPCVQ